MTTSIGNRSADAADIADMLNYGLVIEYSFLYLQSFVKNIGIEWPLNRIFPVMKLNFKTVLNGPKGGQTIGMANPGVIWTGRYYEIGVEAIAPLLMINNIGMRALIHLFLDDLFQDTYGRIPFGVTVKPMK